MRKLIIAVAAVAAAGVLSAPAASAAPCAYFGSTPGNGICGVPNINQSVQNAQTNLKNNLNPQTAMNNLAHNLTHGVGTAG